MRITPRRAMVTTRRFGVLGQTHAPDHAPSVRRGGAERVFLRRPEPASPLVLRGGDSHVTLAPHFSALVSWFITSARKLYQGEDRDVLHTATRLERRSLRNTLRTRAILDRAERVFVRVARPSFVHAPGIPSALVRERRTVLMHRDLRRPDGAAPGVRSDILRHRTIRDVATEFVRGTRSEQVSRIARHEVARAVTRVDRTVARLHARSEQRVTRHVQMSDVVERHLAARSGHAPLARPVRTVLGTPTERAHRAQSVAPPEAARTSASRPATAADLAPLRPVTPTERVFRAPETPQPPPPVPNSVARPATPKAPEMDIARLDAELWRRFEKRIRIEQDRRGRR
ncbi:MAG: hypothetical protein AAFR35_09885 [Pseudomonadota bacterium]